MCAEETGGGGPLSAAARGEQQDDRAQLEPGAMLRPGLRRAANGGEVLASPSIAISNRLLGWLRNMDSLREAIGTAA
jgi:hypothetical protein